MSERSVLLVMQKMADRSPHMGMTQAEAPAIIHNQLKEAGFNIMETDDPEYLWNTLNGLEDLDTPIHAIVCYGRFAGGWDKEGDELRGDIIGEIVSLGNGIPVILVGVPFMKQNEIPGTVRAVEYQGDEAYHDLHGQFYIDVLQSMLT